MHYRNTGSGPVTPNPFIERTRPPACFACLRSTHLGHGSRRGSQAPTDTDDLQLTEELLLDNSESATTIDGVTIARPTTRDHQLVRRQVGLLLEACRARDLGGFIAACRQLVPEWQPSREFAAFIEGTTDQIPIISEH